VSDQGALRRYLLHRSTDDEREAIEQEYFADEGALDAAAAEEDALIEDYLAQRLGTDDRVQFERVYGSTPERRVRVQLSRALNAAASRPSHTPTVDRRWLYGSLAAAAVVVLAVGVWFGQRQAPQTAAINPERPNAPITSSPVPQPDTSAPQNPGPPVVALTLSPIAVRGTDDAATLIPPPGSQLVSLTVEGVEAAATTALRAIVRTVDGREVWRGNAVSTATASGQARFDIPVDRLPPDDYIVTVYGVVGDQERELQRYFLRVRAR
jgi:hypothetical protein